MTRYEIKVRRPDGTHHYGIQTADTPLEACRRWADLYGWRHPGAEIVAYRDADRHGIWPGIPERIAE